MMHPTTMRSPMRTIGLAIGLSAALAAPAAGQGGTASPAAVPAPPDSPARLPVDTSTTHVLKTVGAEWPADPGPRAAAQEAKRKNDEGLALYQAGRRTEARAALEAAVAAAERGWG